MDKAAKVVVIVGASSGLGKALAEKLSKKNYTLILLSRTIESVEFPFETQKINCDIQNSQSITTAFQQIDILTKRIDVLVNCAGIPLVKLLKNTSQDEIATVIATNLSGVIMSSQEAYKRMLPKESGHIINISSTSGIKARPNETIYCASKWGLRGFTESLRLEAVPHKIRVTGIYPGGMQTNFWKGIEPSNLEAYMEPADIAEQIVHIIQSPTSLAPSEIVIERGL